MFKKYIVEAVGTFGLSFVVLLAVMVGSTNIPVPVIAGLTLGLFVYSIGAISGCHINPAVTVALASIKKISIKDAMYYIIAQFVGAALAFGIVNLWDMISYVHLGVFNTWQIFFAEMLGALFFGFGIAAVVYGKAKEQMSGVVVGGSLLFGILIASFGGSLGILNPAVALALDAFTPLYILAPIIGATLGMHLYTYLSRE